MTYLCDLHLHSTASDGQYHPAEVVRMAKEKGLQVIALTDHDTTDGVSEAVQSGAEAGLRVIPGIEMSAREYKIFHILGYGMNVDAPGFQEAMQRWRVGREERGERITKYLNQRGFPISFSEVEALAEGAVIGRPHFARVMLRHGWGSSWKELFDLYLDSDEFHQVVDYDKPCARECIDTIKSAEGYVSLAHPYQTGLQGEELEALVRRMKDWGLDAIECYHSGHTEPMAEEYLQMAKRFGLYITGGSDFHGKMIKPEIDIVKLELELSFLI